MVVAYQPLRRAERSRPDVSETTFTHPLPGRVASLDVCRGLVMLLLLGEALSFPDVAAARPESAVWAFLSHHQQHVPWRGCALHDVIQPGFSFLVGAAMAFSIAARRRAGQTVARMTRHAAWRAFALITLGILLRSVPYTRTYFTFEDTLTQIGLGYLPLFALAFRPRREQWAAFVAILVGYWAAFALYPVAGADFDYPAAGVPADWPHHLTGFGAHWNMNSNLAWAVDTWFLNLFPREHPFVFNDGAWSTLSFIPTLGTMLLGVLAADVLRDTARSPADRVRWLATAGVICLASALVLDAAGICPIVKRIWTSTFTLWTGGITLLVLAVTYQVVDVLGRGRWAFPLVVIGTNSIAAYCLHELFRPATTRALTTHLGEGAFRILGNAYYPLLLGATQLAVFWLILFWMHRRRVFLRI